MSSLYIETIGQGPDLVLLHGWGCNSGVWQPVQAQLSLQFRLHLVDLPGFGLSPFSNSVHELSDIAKQVSSQVPSNAIWMGWSLGGLVAMQAALLPQVAMAGLITVASSPCFQARDLWPGIAADLLVEFHQLIAQNPSQTLSQFLAMQAMGSKSAKQDIKCLRLAVDSRPAPVRAALDAGLDLLQQIDLRSEISNIQLPWLRIYGQRDALVPKRVLTLVDTLAQGESVMFSDSAHAPFVSETERFISVIELFLSELDYTN